MPRVWKLIVRPDPEAPDTGQGYAFAETAEEARVLAGDIPHLLVFEKHPLMRWPGPPGDVIDWSWGPPRLKGPRFAV